MNVEFHGIKLKIEINGHNMGICGTISELCSTCRFGKEGQSYFLPWDLPASYSNCSDKVKNGCFDPAEHTSGHFSQQHLHCRLSAGSTFKVLAISEVSLSSGLSAHKKSGPNMDLGLGRDLREVYYLFYKTAVNKYSLEHQSKKQVCDHFVFQCASLIESNTSQISYNYAHNSFIYLSIAVSVHITLFLVFL